MNGAGLPFGGVPMGVLVACGSSGPAAFWNDVQVSPRDVFGSPLRMDFFESGLAPEVYVCAPHDGFRLQAAANVCGSRNNTGIEKHFDDSVFTVFSLAGADGAAQRKQV